MPKGVQAAKSEISTSKVLDAALELFSTQGYGATSMRAISEASGLSVGNLYHHFGSKEAIFQNLIDEYWEMLLDPDNQLQQLFSEAAFPDDLEDLAAAIEQSVEDFKPYIMLIFIDVIEFGGRHIRTFYETMAERFQTAYAESFEQRKRDGLLGAVARAVGEVL